MTQPNCRFRGPTTPSCFTPGVAWSALQARVDQNPSWVDFVQRCVELAIDGEQPERCDPDATAGRTMMQTGLGAGSL